MNAADLAVLNISLITFFFPVSAAYAGCARIYHALGKRMQRKRCGYNNTVTQYGDDNKPTFFHRLETPSTTLSAEVSGIRYQLGWSFLKNENPLCWEFMRKFGEFYKPLGECQTVALLKLIRSSDGIGETEPPMIC